MKKDVMKIINETRDTIPDKYGLWASEIRIICKESNIYQACIDGFAYGYAMGRRAERAEKKDTRNGNSKGVR